MKKPISPSLFRGLLAGLFVVLAPLCASADFVYSGLLNLSISRGTGTINVDLDGGLASKSSLPGYDVSFGFFALEEEAIALYKATNNSWYVMNSGSFPIRYSLDDALPTSGGTNTSTYMLSAYGGGNWASSNSTVTGYLSLYRSSGSTLDYTAWIQVSWNEASDTLTLIDFACDSSATMLMGQTTAPVPEPATSAALAGAFILAASVLFRRRKSV